MAHTPHNPRTGKPLFSVAVIALACTCAVAQTAPKPSPSQAPAAPPNTMVPAIGAKNQPGPALAPVEMPNWPANQPPAPATVKWDSQGLQVTASNSSLRQILTEISTRTGAKLEGFTSDERVYGQYGPGQARDVLAQLLHGSGYNVLLIGDQGQGTPRQIVLSRRSASGAGNAQPSQPNDSSDDEDGTPISEEQPEPPPVRQPLIPRPGMPGAMMPGPRMGVPQQNTNQQPQ